MSRALVILGHGSRNPAAGEQFQTLVTQIRARHKDPVYPAFMELAEPSLDDALAAALAAGADEITVQPCFLFEGNHIRRDIPAMLAEFADQHPATVFSYGRPIGADTRLADMLLERAAEAPCLG
ncbi:MAG: sirohydrochlorin chelatase [Thermoleophilia bacterium]|jgi:sirohydrochlorin ferrochelatase